MRKYIFIINLLISFGVSAQELDPDIPENLLGNLSEDDPETEVDLQGDAEQAIYAAGKSIDINTVSPENLAGFLFLSPVQRVQFFRYRLLLGPFVCLEELQSIPGWDLSTVRRFASMVRLGSSQERISPRQFWKGGSGELLVRASRIIEKSSGYLPNSSGRMPFKGDPQRWFCRYTYRFNSAIQYGLTMEKDPGETFFGTGPKGFDFFSFHLAIRNQGWLKLLVIGDYRLNLGQGLIHWQGLAFRKGSAVLQIKREAPALVPYRSADENRFHRGIAVTIGKKLWELTTFLSADRLDATTGQDLQTGARHFTNFQTSGYHRTMAELANRDILTQFTAGFGLQYRQSNFGIGLNGIAYAFNLPAKPSNEPYKLYAISGKSWFNTSLNYQYTFRNFHFFGEFAADKKSSAAWIQGVLASLDKNFELALYYRNMPKGFQSISGNTFTESTAPTNEKGIYLGFNWRLKERILLAAYFDRFEFPWLRYRVNQPGYGNGWLLQLNWKHRKKIEILVRLKTEDRMAGNNMGSDAMNFDGIQWKGFRLHINYIYNKYVSLRCRQEFCWVKPGTGQAEKGYLGFADIIYRPSGFPLRFEGRLAYFQTDSYNSRLYSFENDLLYNYVIPSYSGKGMRYYLNFRWPFKHHFQICLKWSQWIYSGKEPVGTGYDQIPGHLRSEIRVQFVMVF